MCHVYSTGKSIYKLSCAFDFIFFFAVFVGWGWWGKKKEKKRGGNFNVTTGKEGGGGRQLAVREKGSPTVRVRPLSLTSFIAPSVPCS
jgi:hypothetical protein